MKFSFHCSLYCIVKFFKPCKNHLKSNKLMLGADQSGYNPNQNRPKHYLSDFEMARRFYGQTPDLRSEGQNTKSD